MNLFDENWKTFLIETAASINLQISQEQAEKFRIYASELVSWNKKKNLTSITDPRDIAVLHFVDSVFVCKKIEANKNIKILDTGTGGGFPGIPLKIMCPDIDITLLDSSGKKVSFLKYMIRELELTGIKAVNDRAEIFARNNINKFDYVVSRAFTSIESFFEMVWPCVCETGKILALKGPDTDDEISKLKMKSYEYDKKIVAGKDIVFETTEYDLPVVDHKRKIISLTY